MKDEITVGKSWDEVIHSCREIHQKKRGNPAFPVTIAVDDLAAHYTTDHSVIAPEGWDREMVFQNGT